MAVLARIVPAHAVVVEGATAATYCKRHLVRRDRMADCRPRLATRVHCRQRLHRHLQDAGDLRRADLAADRVVDRYLLRAEMRSDQGCEGCHRAALGSAEDRAKRRSLLIVGTLVDVGSKRPVALAHW